MSLARYNTRSFMAASSASSCSIRANRFSIEEGSKDINRRSRNAGESIGKKKTANLQISERINKRFDEFIKKEPSRTQAKSYQAMVRKRLSYAITNKFKHS